MSSLLSGRCAFVDKFFKVVFIFKEIRERMVCKHNREPGIYTYSVIASWKKNSGSSGSSSGFFIVMSIDCV